MNKNGDVSVDLTVVVDPIQNKKTQKLGTLMVLESSLDEVVGELSRAHWNVEVEWLSQRAPYKLRMKLEGNIYKVIDTTKFYKFTSVGENVVKFVLNGNAGNNLFDVRLIDRTYTFKSALFSGVEFYDVNGGKLKQSAKYNRMDAVYVFLENDYRMLSEIKNKAVVRNKAKVLASKTITKYINEHFPICNGSRYMISPEGYSEKVLSEIKNSGVFTVSRYLNKADELNGTIWKGSISLVGDVSRELQSLEKGWSEWRENKITYVRLDVQIKDDGGEKVIYEVKDNYWHGKKQEKKLSLQKLDCLGVDQVAGVPALNNIGMKYLTDKDYKKSLTWFIKSAEEGDSLADYYIGYFHENGLGVKKSINKALFWYKKSADKGNSIAQNHLGNIYSQGIGVNRSNDEAYGWYKKSAELGNALAQGRLGYLYLNGLGVQRSENMAFFWYKKSAEQGNALAQSLLAKSYKNGVGVPKDEKQALIWSSKVEAQGFKDTSEKYSNVNKNLAITNKKLIADSIKITKANKKLGKTNIKLTKDNIKTNLINNRLVKANKKLIAENKRLVKLSNRLARKSKRRSKPAAIVKKNSKLPVNIKQSTQVNKVIQQPASGVRDVAQQNKETIKTTGVVKAVNTEGKSTKTDGVVVAEKSPTQPVNKGTSSATEQSTVNNTALKEGTVQPATMKLGEKLSQ